MSDTVEVWECHGELFDGPPPRHGTGYGDSDGDEIECGPPQRLGLLSLTRTAVCTCAERRTGERRVEVVPMSKIMRNRRRTDRRQDDE